MTGPADPAGRRRTWIVIGAIVAAALVLRWPGLFDGPGYSNRDELMYVPKAVRYGGGDLSPHYFHNPPLASYLMFGALLVWYAVGRMTGEFASALDFKAQYLADPSAAFVVGRSTSLLLGVAGVAATFVLARRLLPDGRSRARRDAAGAAAAILLAASPVHAERSAAATNEALVTTVTVLAILASLRLVRSGGWRDAIVAGALVGVAAGSKYTGALVCVPVGVAALLAQGADARRRIGLAATTGAACVAAFLVVCPWAVLESGTFFSHVSNLFVLRDRGPTLSGADALRRSVGEYGGFAWTSGLGAVGCAVAVAGVVLATVHAVRSRGAERAVALVGLASCVPFTLYLLQHTHMANGRYLMPVYPAFLALGAAFIARRGEGAAKAGVAAALVGAVILQHGAAARWTASRAQDTQARAAAWLREHAPDGAIVVGDWHAPRLPAIESRREFEGRVPASTMSRLRPSFRTATAFDYFEGELSAIPGATARVDDFAALAAAGPSYAVVSDLGEATFDDLPPGDYAGRRWYVGVRERMALVHEVLPGPGLRGPAIRVYESKRP